MLLRNFFSKRGFEVTICHTLKEGLNALSSHVFNIIILDNNLPDGLGWDQADFITATHIGVKLALISAHPHRNNFIVPKSAFVWEKPISLSELNILVDYVE